MIPVIYLSLAIFGCIASFFLVCILFENSRSRSEGRARQGTREGTGDVEVCFVKMSWFISFGYADFEEVHQWLGGIQPDWPLRRRTARRRPVGGIIEYRSRYDYRIRRVCGDNETRMATTSTTTENTTAREDDIRRPQSGDDTRNGSDIQSTSHGNTPATTLSTVPATTSAPTLGTTSGTTLGTTAATTSLPHQPPNNPLPQHTLPGFPPFTRIQLWYVYLHLRFRGRPPPRQPPNNPPPQPQPTASTMLRIHPIHAWHIYLDLQRRRLLPAFLLPPEPDNLPLEDFYTIFESLALSSTPSPKSTSTQDESESIIDTPRSSIRSSSPQQDIWADWNDELWEGVQSLLRHGECGWREVTSRWGQKAR